LLLDDCIHKIEETLEKTMPTWIHPPYFFIAFTLMAILQTNQFMDGKTTLLESILAVVFGGIFWGAIATFAKNKIGKK
jgi:hypothetical protein